MREKNLARPLAVWHNLVPLKIGDIFNPAQRRTGKRTGNKTAAVNLTGIRFAVIFTLFGLRLMP